MLKFFFLVFACLSLNAQAQTDAQIEAVRSLANARFRSKDLLVAVTRARLAQCHAAEESGFLVNVMVNKYERYPNFKTGQMDFRDKWTTVKTYQVSDSELSKPAPKLLDTDLCNE